MKVRSMTRTAHSILRRWRNSMNSCRACVDQLKLMKFSDLIGCRSSISFVFFLKMLSHHDTHFGANGPNRIRPLITRHMPHSLTVTTYTNRDKLSHEGHSIKSTEGRRKREMSCNPPDQPNAIASAGPEGDPCNVHKDK